MRARSARSSSFAHQLHHPHHPRPQHQAQDPLGPRLLVRAVVGGRVPPAVHVHVDEPRHHEPPRHIDPPPAASPPAPAPPRHRPRSAPPATATSPRNATRRSGSMTVPPTRHNPPPPPSPPPPPPAPPKRPAAPAKRPAHEPACPAHSCSPTPPARRRPASKPISPRPEARFSSPDRNPPTPRSCAWAHPRPPPRESGWHPPPHPCSLPQTVRLAPPSGSPTRPDPKVAGTSCSRHPSPESGCRPCTSRSTALPGSRGSFRAHPPPPPKVAGDLPPHPSPKRGWSPTPRSTFRPTPRESGWHLLPAHRPAPKVAGTSRRGGCAAVHGCGSGAFWEHV